MKITIDSKEDRELPGGAGPVAATGRKKGSSVRHTRAIQRDRSKRPASDEPAEPVAERLAEVVHPATLAQVGDYHDLGLRQRTLNLPVMAALVLSLIWRQFGLVSELARAPTTDGLLWAGPVPIRRRSAGRRSRRGCGPSRRSCSPGSWRRSCPTGRALGGADQPFAGRMLAVLDVCSHLPRRIWYEENPRPTTCASGPGSGRCSRKAPCSSLTWPTPASASSPS